MLQVDTEAAYFRNTHCKKTQNTDGVQRQVMHANPYILTRLLELTKQVNCISLKFSSSVISIKCFYTNLYVLLKISIKGAFYFDYIIFQNGR